MTESNKTLKSRETQSVMVNGGSILNNLPGEGTVEGGCHLLFVPAAQGSPAEQGLE